MEPLTRDVDFPIPVPTAAAQTRPRLRGPALAPALDDSPLAIAADALALGQWARVRTLLAETGEDWDLRGHRLTVLATAPDSAAWAGDWRLAEPDSGDAATLLALATVRLAVHGASSTEAAAGACAAAARMLPGDPTPWLGALILARRTGTPEARDHAFQQIRARHRDHHHAHHLMTAALAEQRPGARDDPRHPAHTFAARAAARAPADSPLALLPVVAHTERYRVLAAAGRAPRTDRDHWSTRRAHQILRDAFDWWLEWGGEDHPAARSISTSSPMPPSTRGGWPRPPRSSSASARTPPAPRGRTRAATPTARSGPHGTPPSAGPGTPPHRSPGGDDDESLTPGPGRWPRRPPGARIEP